MSDLEERDGWRKLDLGGSGDFVAAESVADQNQRLAMVFPLAWLGRGSRSAKMPAVFYVRMMMA